MLGLTLAIIEDDEVLLNRITKVLRREIKEVKPYNSPEEFLEDINNYTPDTVITDINMPKINGLKMIEILREKEFEIPVILASAFSEPNYFIDAIKLKVRRFLIKPIDIDVLLEELKTIDNEIKLKKDLEKKENLLLVQSKMAAMGEMLANIAHQWKQPLNSISISTSSIQLANDLGTQLTTQEIKDLTDNIMKSVRYMDQTVNDFQNYFKPNKLEECFYLKDTLRKALELLNAQCNLHEIQIIKNIDDDVSLCSYENELLQVLINLVKNSIDQLINIKSERFIFIDIFSKNENDVIIEIKDNGGGISEKVIDKVFESYFTTKGDKGTGIGLYLSKDIVENHLHGFIKVRNSKFVYKNSEYTGACFKISLISLKC